MATNWRYAKYRAMRVMMQPAMPKTMVRMVVVCCDVHGGEGSRSEDEVDAIGKEMGEERRGGRQCGDRCYWT